MKRKYRFIVLACTMISLAAPCGVFAVCIERRCSDTTDRTDCIRAKWEYDDCIKQEQEAREAKRAAAEQEQRAKEEGKDSKKYQYPFLDDIREINKKNRY